MDSRDSVVYPVMTGFTVHDHKDEKKEAAQHLQELLDLAAIWGRIRKNTEVLKFFNALFNGEGASIDQLTTDWNQLINPVSAPQPKGDEIISLLKKLNEAGKDLLDDMEKRRGIHLYEERLAAWVHSMVAVPFLMQKTKGEIYEPLKEAISHALPAIKDPVLNPVQAKQILKSTAVVRSKVEGCYLSRHEARVLRGLLLALGMLAVGALFVCGGLELFDLIKSHGELVMLSIVGVMCVGGGGLMAPLFALGILIYEIKGKESKEEMASRELAASLKGLANAHARLYSGVRKTPPVAAPVVKGPLLPKPGKKVNDED